MSKPTEETADPDGSVGVPANTDTGLAADDRHSILASKRRRLALDVLAAVRTPLDLEELATDVAAREEGNNADPEDSAHARRRVAIELHHNHLPRLDEYDLVDYDPSLRLISVSDGAIDSIR